MKKILFLSVLLLMAFSASFAQKTESNDRYFIRCADEDPDYPITCGLVIALGGLKLRDSPSFEGKVLDAMPFGSKLTRLHVILDKDQEDDIVTSDSIRGNWEEVEYDAKRGWAFNAFIGQGILRLTEEYILLFPEYGGGEEVGISPEYNYYGVYANEDSIQWNLQKIKPIFYCYYDGQFFNNVIKAETKTQPAFIVATKKQLSDGIIPGKKLKAMLFEMGRLHQMEVPKKYSQPIPPSPFILDVVERKILWNGDSLTVFKVQITDNISGRKQILDIDVDYRVVLEWMGDLDHDGMIDFLLHSFGQSADGEFDGFQLFLTGSAAEGEIVYQVPYFLYHGICAR